MGGYGSGRRRDRAPVEECCEINVFDLNQKGFLRKGISVQRKVKCSYGVNVLNLEYSLYSVQVIWLFYNPKDWWGENENVTMPVFFTSTHPNYGGVRFWFICPVRGCGRRVAKIYLPPKGRYFACRECYGLTYRSCQVASKVGLVEQAMARLERLQRSHRALK